MRTVVRTLIAGFLALAGPVLAAPAAGAYVQGTSQQSSGTDGASSHQLTISIDAVSPSFATVNSTVTVRGTLTNDTGSPLQGVQVQLLTEDVDFLTRSQMDSYAAGSTTVMSPQPIGTSYAVSGTLREGATVSWSASFTAAAAGYSVFGVYPLEAQAVSADGSTLATEPTFLPFWPGKGSADPLSTAWLWPLIDEPQQGACPQTLATNALAASLSSGGRLGTLLSAGEQWAQRDQLTWIVDPALLSDANVMSRAYLVGGDSLCKGGAREPASTAAAGWLSALRTGTAGEPMVVTPYADVDVAALAHAGLDNDLRTAYQVGESVARQILSRAFGINGQGPGDGGSPALAWPADGVADASVLTSLASYGGISTVVLNSSELPSTDAPFDNALAATTTKTGATMPVLLADSELTSVLGSAPAGSPAGAQFAAEQDFLAQTAMISAEAPYLKRSLVIAPPQRWDPSAAEAAALLSLTASAPWLRPTGLSTLAAAAGDLKTRQSLPGSQVSPSELNSSYLDNVRSVDTSVALYSDLLFQPGASYLQSLDAAVAATESSAWRTSRAAGQLALHKLADYLSDREQKIQILEGTKPLLLAGSSGPAPVSVQNAGPLAVQVRVRVVVPPRSQLSVRSPDDPLTVQSGTTGTLTMTVHSSGIGTTTVQLQLVTRNGLPLTWPGASQSLSIEATRYGRALLVLIAAALGVLVLTSVARWLRRRQNDRRADGRAGGTG